MGIDLGAFGFNLVVMLAVVLALILGTFGLAVRRRRYDTIDSVWGLGFAVIALVTFGLSNGHGELALRLLITALTVLWGLRLSAHIHTRNASRREDRRYAAIVVLAGVSATPRRYLLTRVYLVQAGYMWLVSLPVQAAQYGSGGPALLRWGGTAIWLVGMCFEGIGDAQLRRFRADPANSGKVLDHGLWRYTRHPNYFGDACVWWGLYLLACTNGIGAATIFAPLTMTILLAKGIGGKPMLERHLLVHRPDYADYVRRTSGFFPLPPARHNSRIPCPAGECPPPGRRSRPGRPRRGPGRSSAV